MDQPARTDRTARFAAVIAAFLAAARNAAEGQPPGDRAGEDQ